MAISVQLGARVFKLPVMVGPGNNNGNGNPNPNGNGPPEDRPDHKPPTTPTGLIASGGDARVQLSWAPATDKVNLNGYRVYRQNSDGSWQAIGTTDADTVTYTDTGLTNGRTYTYFVTAYDGAGNESSPSGSASATPKQPPDTTPPTAPSGLNATAGDSQVDLSWAAATDARGVAGYRVYRQNADGSWPTTPTLSTDASARSFTDTGLTNGTAYSYRVTAIDAAGNESVPATSSATPQLPPDLTAPTAPAGVTATAGDGQVELSWSAASDDRGVAAYRIYRQNSDGSWPLTNTANTAADVRSFVDKGLANGTTYSYRVTAIDAAGNESPPASASATPQPPPDTTAPTAPSLLNATAGDGQVRLGWRAASDDRGVTGYHVYLQDGDGSWPSTPIANLPAAARTFTDTGLTNGTAYTYHVTATDAAGNESAPATASATPQPPPDTAAPSVPDGLTAAPSDGQVTIAWNASTDNTGVTSYGIYRQNADGTWPDVPTATTDAATLTWTDTAVTNGTSYTYGVTAIDAAGNESGLSAPASATPEQPVDLTPPTAPDGLTGTAGDGQVELTWNAASDDRGVAAYRIYRQNDDGSWPLTSTANTDAGTLQWTDTSLTDGTAYTYRVTAIDAAGNESAPSGTVTATPLPDTTPPTAPDGLTASAGDQQVELTWNSASDDRGVTGYRVYRQNDDGSWPSAATAETDAATRTFADTNLTDGTAYTYRVTAIDAAGNESDPSGPATATPLPDTTPPTAPNGLTATAGDRQVVLSWNAASDDRGVTGYRVYRQNDDGTWPVTATASTDGSTLTWSDTGDLNGTVYIYRVTAIDAAGNESDPSATASATPHDTSPPTAPSGLTATGSHQQVSLAWSASTDDTGVTGYRLYRQNADGSWPTTATAEMDPTTRSFTDTGLTNGTAYTYQVTAIDAAGNESAASATAFAAPAAPACGTSAAPPTTWDHVVWIVMENRDYSQIVGDPSAPYENSLAAQCGLATNYFAITHPSLPNYIAMTSGDTQGIADDQGPGAHQLDVESIFSQLGTGGWRALQESMPATHNCSLVNSGLYVVRHNPAAYYTNIRTDCGVYDVTLTDPPDISARFTFITPNKCNDTHDCPVSSGDNWLKGFIPKLTSSPEYQAGSTAIFVTWDEDDSGNTGNQVPTFVIAPSTVPGTQSTTMFSHYALLHTTEEMLGLPFLGGVATAPSMRGDFNLG